MPEIVADPPTGVRRHLAIVALAILSRGALGSQVDQLPATGPRLDAWPVTATADPGPKTWSRARLDRVWARTSGPLRHLKYRASRRMSPKAYWYLMGRLRPVRAVTSDNGSIEQCLASGEDAVATLTSFGPLRSDMVTLHIGSGLGRVEYHLSQKVKRCVGVDISPSMIKRARELVPFDNVEFVESDGADLSAWPDGFFDLIYSFFVFQHLSRTQFHRYLADAQTKLRSGGQLVFQILLDDAGAHPDPPADHPYGIRYYRRRDVETALRDAGFSQFKAANADDQADVVFCAVKGNGEPPPQAGL